MPMTPKQTAEKLEPRVRRFPSIILGLCAVLWLFTKAKWYEAAYPVLCELAGPAVLTMVPWLIYAILHDYKTYQIITICTLILLNIVNLVFYSVNSTYFSIYAGIVIFSGMLNTIFGILTDKRK